MATLPFHIVLTAAVVVFSQACAAENLLPLPPFDVDVQLSSSASAKLHKSNDSVVVIAYYSGLAAPEHIDNANEVGEIAFGDQRVEIASSGRARFSGLSYDTDKLEWIKDKKLMLLINVVSGRKSSEDNLLDCEIYSDEIKLAAIQPINIGCKLIHGE